MLTFAILREEREWTKNVVQQFKMIAQIFANALTRKQTEQMLLESEARLRISTDAAGAGLWSMKIDTGQVWVTPKTRQLFHFGPDEKLNFESFFKVIHPDDYEQVGQAVQKAIRGEENLLSEYRIVLPDGSIRWIMARGHLQYMSDEDQGCLMGVSLDITKNKQAEQELEERLRFEKLLTEISTRFINQPVERISHEIKDAQRRICELLNLDFSALWQWSDEACNILSLRSFYSTREGALPFENMTQEHFPWCRQQMLAGRIVSVSSLEELPAEAATDRESCRLFGIKSNLTFPLSVGDDPPIGVLGLNTTRAERDWPEALVKRLQLLAEIFTNALERKRMDIQLRDHLSQIEKLRQQCEKENICLQQEVKALLEHNRIVGHSAPMKNILAMAEQVALTDSTVLILGETGTGKGLLARVIHGISTRKKRVLVTVNCAALPPSLIESELFGREKGAYTGALTKMVGRFELADESTIFLDEIGELPHDVQSKLLQVLDQGRFERLGSTTSLQANVRVIAATNRDLTQDVKEGRFRKDLYYRLNVFPILIPPLRERTEDIPLMVWAFVKEFQKRMGKEIENIPKKTMEILKSYSWPGNVRELKNVIENAMILNKDKRLNVNLSGVPSLETLAVSRLDDVERSHIKKVLERTGWRVAGKGGAAETLGLRRTTLYSKMKKLGIDRPTLE